MRSSFCDTIVVRSTARGDLLMRALEEVTLREMPLARFLGRLRYLPSLLRGGDAAGASDRRPFLREVLTSGRNIVLERAPDELVIGVIGKLHQIRNQERYRAESPAQFEDFHAPGYEKLVISVRTVRVVAGTLLVLEHRTLPLDESARLRFARYWQVIRPAGAFVTRQLLEAVSARACRPPEAVRIRARTRLAHF